MEETLEKQILPSEEKDSDEGGIRLRLRDRDLLKKRKAEAEEETTYRWVYGAQSIKRVKKRSSGAPGRKGRPRKEACVDVPEDQAQETDAVAITEPALPTRAEPLTVDTVSENPLEGFLIEDLGPEEEKSLVTDAGDVPEQSQSSRNPAAPDDPTLFSTEEWV
ncbi:hypothetical protein cypCar_00030101 [Cyprinus carpio]|nr:hypothetical protein cypCar_00030101 [Cyprinus carpio]